MSNKTQNKSEKALIILPAYNEAKVISNVIKQIKNQGYNNILVVNDKSSDNTESTALKENVQVITHPINRGAGAATATGIEYAKQNNYKQIVLMDSDGQHNPKDIAKLIAPLEKNQADVVIGSRMIGDLTQMPIQRKIANFIGSLITWFFFGKYVKDSQSGFKAMNSKAINKIKITFDRYEFCSEIIGEIYKHNLKVKEVPIQVLYSNHSMQKGHGQSISNGFKMIFKFIMKN